MCLEERAPHLLEKEVRGQFVKASPKKFKAKTTISQKNASPFKYRISLNRELKSSILCLRNRWLKGISDKSFLSQKKFDNLKYEHCVVVIDKSVIFVLIPAELNNLILLWQESSSIWRFETPPCLLLGKTARSKTTLAMQIYVKLYNWTFRQRNLKSRSACNLLFMSASILAWQNTQLEVKIAEKNKCKTIIFSRKLPGVSECCKVKLAPNRQSIKLQRHAKCYSWHFKVAAKTGPKLEDKRGR